MSVVLHSQEMQTRLVFLLRHIKPTCSVQYVDHARNRRVPLSGRTPLTTEWVKLRVHLNAVQILSTFTFKTFTFRYSRLLASGLQISSHLHEEHSFKQTFAIVLLAYGSIYRHHRGVQGTPTHSEVDILIIQILNYQLNLAICERISGITGGLYAALIHKISLRNYFIWNLPKEPLYSLLLVT